VTPILEQWAAQIINAVPNILAALIIFLASIYFARLVSNLTRKVLQRRNIAAYITNLLAQTIRWTILIIGLVTALQQFFNVTAFLTGLGILGFTIGFALQDVMKNFAAGMILLLQKPFNEGDAINVEGFDGVILTIDLRSTEIKTFDGRIVIIPNASMLTNAIVNYTRANRRRIEIPLQVPSTTDPQLVQKLALEALQGVPGFVSEPAPTVVFQMVTDSSLHFTSFFWVEVSGDNLTDAREIAVARLKEEFRQNDISVPA
jgi:small-conductance mechanosensitive channel